MSKKVRVSKITHYYKQKVIKFTEITKTHCTKKQQKWYDICPREYSRAILTRFFLIESLKLSCKGFCLIAPGRISHTSGPRYVICCVP